MRTLIIQPTSPACHVPGGVTYIDTYTSKKKHASRQADYRGGSLAPPASTSFTIRAYILIPLVFEAIKAASFIPCFSRSNHVINKLVNDQPSAS